MGRVLRELGGREPEKTLLVGGGAEPRRPGGGIEAWGGTRSEGDLKGRGWGELGTQQERSREPAGTPESR